MADRYALIIVTTRLDQPGLTRIPAPTVDAPALERVLKDPRIGRFDAVTTLIDGEAAAVSDAVRRFFDRGTEDSLLVYVYGLDAEGLLLPDLLRDLVQQRMPSNQVLILDIWQIGLF